MKYSLRKINKGLFVFKDIDERNKKNLQKDIYFF
jgi:hypothetical protein